MRQGTDVTTADALGLGGLLVDAYRAMQLLASEYDVCRCWVRRRVVMEGGVFKVRVIVGGEWFMCGLGWDALDRKCVQQSKSCVC